MTMKAKCRIDHIANHEWDPGKVVCQCGERKMILIDGQEESVYTGDPGISSTSNEVRKLERKYESMKLLAGEMIATLIIQNNKKLFDHMPAEWFSVVGTWGRDFRELVNDDSN